MHILAIDAGTTGVTAILYKDQVEVASAYQEFTQYFPEPGWVEHDVEEIWEATLAVARQTLEDAGLDAPDAIGITNQRETIAIWDADGPLHRAIVWQDRRTAETCRKMKRQAKLIKAKTGLVLDPYFSATKLAWLLDETNGRREGIMAGTIDTWLAWKLTGQHVTDPTNASRTMLWDIHRSCWDDELLALFNIPRSMLPRVVPSSHVVGPCPALGNAPLASMVGDQQAALFGQGCMTAGEAKNTYGTGCFLLQHTGTEAKPSKHLLTTRAASLDDTPQYALEGSVFVGGAAVQWLRDGLKIAPSAPEVDHLAQTTDSSEGVVVVPSFTGLGAPYWDPEARGAILGLTRGTTRRHIARATLQSIALQSHDLVRAMEKDGLSMGRLRVDGGATASKLLMQFQADLLRVPVEVTASQSTARGAALLAGYALGVKELAPPPVQVTYKPKAPKREVSARLRRWKKAVKAVRAFGA